ncbi:MAG: HEAT repeat domain-containing protein [Acidimicrobiia bacterium]
MPRTRREVALAGHTGDVEAAAAALDDPDPGVRVTALGALERLDRMTDTVLRRALNDDAATVRRRACELAAAYPDVDIVASLADDDVTVAEMAAWSLGEQSPPREHAVEALCGVVRDHGDALVREAAVAALGAIGDDRGLPSILHALADKATVRRRAVIALAPFDGPEVDAALRAALDDRDWQVRQAAEDLLD